MKTKEKKEVITNNVVEEKVVDNGNDHVVDNVPEIKANEVTDVSIPDVAPEDIIFHGSTNPDEEKELIKVEDISDIPKEDGQVQNELMPKEEKETKDYPTMCMANIYTIRENVNNLSGNNVVHDYLGQLFHRSNQLINQFEKNYIHTLPINSKEHREYNEKLERILIKYVDKDKDGKLIREGNDWKISDPLKQEFSKNSLAALSEEYKDYIKQFDVFKKVMDYVYVNHFLSNSDIDYLLTDNNSMHFENAIGYTITFPDYETIVAEISMT